MARSVLRTIRWIFVMIIIVAIGAGGAFGWLKWQQWQWQKDLQVARQALSNGEAAKAEPLLDRRWLQAKPGDPWSAELVELRLECMAQLEENEARLALAKEILNSDPAWVKEGEAAWLEAQRLLGEEALGNRDTAAARKHFEALLAHAGSSTEGLEGARLGLARLDLAEGKAEEARPVLESLVTTLPADSPEREQAERALGVLNTRELFSRNIGPNDEVYVVAKGDSFYKIGRQYKIASDLLMAINQISSPRQLSIGKRLKIPQVDFSIEVDKGLNKLTLYNHGKFFKSYRVRTGAENYMTPVGTFKIENKKVDPQWTNPKDGKVYAPGAPDNQLGARWMGFQGSNIGIHEAIDPATLGTYSSNGCVGMAHDDVVELYNLVPQGTPLKIIDSRTSGAL